MRFKLLVSVLLAGVLVAGGARAEGFQTKIVGGPGGSAWELNCPNSRSLVGVYIRFTNFVEQLDAICVASTDGSWLDAPRRVTSNSYNMSNVLLAQPNKAIGGTGGSQENTIVCVRNSVVYALTVATAVSSGRGDHEVVGSIELHCVNTKTAREDVVTPIPGPEGADEYVTRWPADCRSQAGKYWATGLVGRAGSFVDAIGLRCASPSAPDRPMRERVTKNPEVLSPVGVKALGRVHVSPGTQGPPPSICESAQMARARNSPAAPGLEAQCQAALLNATPAKAPDPVVTPPVASLQVFDAPLTVGNERLHACMHLPHSDCDWSPAEAFCQDKGFRTVDSFDTERGQLRSETWTGELCTRSSCRVYTQITCTN